MMNEEMESADIRKQLQKTLLDKPSPTFSSEIMKEIEAEPQRDIQLQKLLGRHAIERPSAYFTENVMSRVKKGEFRNSIQPVISRKVWGIVAMTSIVLTLWTLLSTHAEPDPVLTNYFIDLGKSINTFVSGIPVLYLITFFTVSALVVGDYFIRMGRRISLRF